jgi:hypothetical protein
MFVTLKVFKLIGPSNDGRRHGRGTYLFRKTFSIESRVSTVVQIHHAARCFPLLNVTCSSLARGARQIFCSPELLARAARWICTTVETQLKTVSKIVDDKQKWHLEALLLKKRRFQHLLALPAIWANADAWLVWLASKFCLEHLRDFTNQRKHYWLSPDLILPMQSPFRQRLDLDKKRVDCLKLFASSSMQAFTWHSTHAKLYGQSDLFRF